jgi:transposase-like protein
MKSEFKSLYELFEAIPDELAAVNYFKAIRWRNGEFCPYCGCDKLYPFKDGKTWKCAQCRDRFSIRVGTIFEDSKIPLRKWLAAIWFITSHKKGIASTQLAKDLDVTQKTAWFILHRLRHAARTRSFNRPLRGIVEVDETYIGGKERNKHRRRRGKDPKVLVFGMVERGGELRAKPMASQKDVRPEIFKQISQDAILMTDEWIAYTGLRHHYNHYTVNHGAGEYVAKDSGAHINSMEGVWSLLKRQIYGIHHWVSAKHVHRYVAEATWRFNRRVLKEVPRFAEFLARLDGRLTYKTLIAK